MMTIEEAKDECEHWFAYLDRQREKAAQMQELAAARREGIIDADEARRRLRRLDEAPVVYDGAKLQHAVRRLLKEIR